MAALTASPLILWLLLLMMAAMMMLCSLKNEWFALPPDWHECFPATADPDADQQVYFSCVVLPPLAAFVLEAVGRRFIQPSSFMAYLVVLVMAQLLLWGAPALCWVLITLRREKQVNHADQSNMAEMQTFMNVIRSQRHDYSFHLQTLHGMMAREKWDECQQYIEAQVKDVIRLNTVLPIHDAAVAALISSFESKAAQKQIKLYIDIEDDLSHIAINAYETNKIIGNLLQNAIDEVSTHADRSYGIHLCILKRGEFCMIHVSNRIQAAATGDVFRPGYTTKEGHEGVGLSSVRSLVNRYRGDVYTRLEGDVIHFVATIPTHYTGGQPL